MFEEYYIQVLEYLKTTDEVNPDKMDIDLSKPLLWSVIEELDVEKLINLGKYNATINDKGLAYLELKNLHNKNPTNIDKNTQIHTVHKGMSIFEIINNDWVKLTITAIIAIIIGTYILMKLHIIH